MVRQGRARAAKGADQSFPVSSVRQSGLESARRRAYIMPVERFPGPRTRECDSAAHGRVARPAYKLFRNKNKAKKGGYTNS
jgi:hypothetical protein